MPGRNSLSIRDGVLTVAPRGFDRIWCFRRRVDVPVREIVDVSLEEDPHGVARGLRWPGTQFFGWWIAGTYHPGREKHFWNYAGKGAAIVIALDAESEFDAIYLSVEDPAATVERLRAAAIPRG